MSAEPSRRALVIKLGAIGDVVMAIPAAYALHREGFAIDWLCAEMVAPLLRLYPWIHVLVADERRLLRGTTVERIRALASAWGRLRGRRYDLCATLYYDRRYGALAWPVRARRKLQLSMEDRSLLLLPGRHHTDEYARILLQREEGEQPRQLAPVAAPNLPPSPIPRIEGRSRVVLAPAGAKNMLRDDALRRWPVESYVRLAESLLADGDEVILIGGPDDAWAGPAFASLNVGNAIGRFSLVQTVALLESAEVTVTHDTGPLHLAGITSTAVVGIFGPTDPRGRLPQRENCVALWGGEGFACRPCYDGRNYAACRNNGCMQQVTTTMVLNEVKTLITAKRTGERLPPRVVTPQHSPLLQWEHEND